MNDIAVIRLQKVINQVLPAPFSDDAVFLAVNALIFADIQTDIHTVIYVALASPVDMSQHICL